MGVYTSRRGGSHRHRGIVVPVVLTTLVVLAGFVVLSVDVGHIYNSRTDMQNAVDSGALAGASGLPDGVDVVYARATEYAGRNAVAGTPVAGGELTLVIGNWEGSRGEFFPLTGGEPTSPNAVRVLGTRNGLPLYFAPIFGVSTTTIARSAISTVGSGKCLGIWGLEGITGDGNILTDSYISDDGAYGGTNVHPNGDICSNQDIILNGSVEIHGDAMFGEGYTLDTSGNAYSIWGVIDDHCCDAVAPAIDMVAASITNDNNLIGLTDDGRLDPFALGPWDFLVEGNAGRNLTLNGGTYYFTSASIGGQATVTVTGVDGPTVIFVDGPADFSGGGLINLTQDPSNLIIYSTGATLVLDGNAGFYGAVIAPNATVELTGTGDFYGTIMARILDIDGTADIHVDETLVENLFGLDAVAPVLVD